MKRMGCTESREVKRRGREELPSRAYASVDGSIRSSSLSLSLSHPLPPSLLLLPESENLSRPRERLSLNLRIDGARIQRITDARVILTIISSDIARMRMSARARLQPGDTLLNRTRIPAF